MKIEGSPTVTMKNYAERMKEKGEKIYDFVAGEPEMTTPSHIIDYAFEMARNGKTHYTPSYGVHELREKIAKKYSKKGLKITEENVLVTISKFGIYLSLLSLFQRSGEVMVFDPYYPSYLGLIDLAGMKAKILPTDKDFDLNISAIEENINKNTVALILNSPNNPTGQVYEHRKLKELVNMAEENEIAIISDEIYQEYVYDGEFHSPLEFIKNTENIFLIQSFSKSHAMAGFRVGYVLSGEENIKRLNSLQQNTITTISSISQYAAIRALDDDFTPKILKEMFRKRRDLVFGILKDCGNLNITKPKGAIYLFPRYLKRTGSEKFALDLLKEKKVLVMPGSAFGKMGEFHFRMSLGSSDDMLEEGAERIVEFLSKY